MQIFRQKTEVIKDNNTVLTIGTFDGIHQGHFQILNKVKEIARRKNSRTVFVTFDPHPRKVISEDYDLKLLTSLQEKIEILESYGIDYLFLISFTKEFSRLTSAEFFLEYIINTVGLSDIVIGFDHHFGKDRSGDIKTVRTLGDEYGFNVSVVEPFSVEGENVSSTRIRNALNAGDLLKANKFLGRYYSFKGKVVKGDMRGRELGFPTANLELIDEDKLLPALGIYAVKITLGGQNYLGLLSIGKRPTFYNSDHIVPEVFIYDFDKEIYGEELKAELVERIRDEYKFSGADELIAQMNKDKEAGIKIFNKVI